MIHAGFIDAITQNIDILQIDDDHALSLMHTHLDVYLTLLITEYPDAANIKYVLTYDGYSVKINPCNEFTRGLLLDINDYPLVDR